VRCPAAGTVLPLARTRHGFRRGDPVQRMSSTRGSSVALSFPMTIRRPLAQAFCSSAQRRLVRRAWRIDSYQPNATVADGSAVELSPQSLPRPTPPEIRSAKKLQPGAVFRQASRHRPLPYPNTLKPPREPCSSLCTSSSLPELLIPPAWITLSGSCYGPRSGGRRQVQPQRTFRTFDTQCKGSLSPVFLKHFRL